MRAAARRRGRAPVEARPGEGRRQFRLALGIGLFVAAGAVGAALATWSIDDPSWSHSTGAPATNALGYPGAILADLTMQLIGLACAAFLAPVLVWGFNLTFGRIPRIQLRRLFAWLLAVALAAGFAAMLPVPGNWPLPVGLGGVLGDVVRGMPLAFMPGAAGGLLGIVLAALFGITAFAAFAYAAGIIGRAPAPPAEEAGAARRVAEVEDEFAADNEPEHHGIFSALAGWTLHGWLSLRAAFARRRARRAAAAAAGWEAARAGPGGSAAADEMDEDASAWTAAPAPAGPAQPRGPQIHQLPEPHLAPQPGYAPPQRPGQLARAGGLAAAGARGAVRAVSSLRGLFRSDDGLDDLMPARTPGRHDRTGYLDDGPSNLGLSDLLREVDAAEARGMPAGHGGAAGEQRPEPGQQPDYGMQPVGGDEAFDHFDEADDAAYAAAQPLPPAPAPRPMPVPAGQPASGPRISAPAARPVADPRAARGGALRPKVAKFQMPPLDLLAEGPRGPGTAPKISTEQLERNARRLEEVLDDFGVRGQIIHVRPGPVVTLYELEPAPGIKSSRVIGLSDDIARSMSAIACRVAVIPGKNAIGIELPNATRETVYLRELLASQDFSKAKARLALALGKTIGGEPVIADLVRMPHLLVAGTTGSGKSVSINTMILSLLYRLTPEECRLIMIDPKMLELSVYDGIPHLLTPVVTDPRKAVVALKWTVREMEDRYKKMSKVGVRNIDGFNQRISQAKARGEVLTRTVQTGFDRETGEAVFETEEMNLDQIPYIVVIVDEMADLMMVAGKDIEGAIQRLAQMARAAGIHIVMATQRPSVDVITGTIKANFPTRVSFQVTSKIDSRTILGEQGAEQLLGQGDMLFMAGGGRIQRVHGPFVADEEVEKIVAHLKTQGVPDYLEAITEEDDEDGEESGGGAKAAADDENEGDVYDQAVAVVLRDRKVSTSYIQRRLGIGYNRAASLIERMEKEGVIGRPNSAGKREILVPDREEDGTPRYAGGRG